ncbi:unnamed protein product [Protopolystoma xenopodis]|uniref:Uncharacterized protein n=1 Tax=Protopolystoma xenopodis TaxID=117903 RepID=A0A3S5BWF3_9PLAT|nr:unnamed protein product [Protopolystoma xenopodis]
MSFRRHSSNDAVLVGRTSVQLGVVPSASLHRSSRAPPSARREVALCQELSLKSVNKDRLEVGFHVKRNQNTTKHNAIGQGGMGEYDKMG